MLSLFVARGVVVLVCVACCGSCCFVVVCGRCLLLPLLWLVVD